MTPVLIIPGLGGSGHHHWQTYMERSFPGVSRVDQDDWEQPDGAVWTGRLAAAIAASPGAVLVAHSLGCALVAHAAAEHPDLPVAGALLVAPADGERFTRLPATPLPFRTIVVASSDDPFVTFADAKARADGWGAEFVDAGPLGHIDVDAGLGPWPGGERLLRRLITTGSRAFIKPPVPTIPDDVPVA